MNLLGGIHKGFSPPGMPSVTATSGQARMETSVNYELGYHFEKNGYTAQVVGFFNNYSNILGSDNISGGGLGTNCPRKQWSGERSHRLRENVLRIPWFTDPLHQSTSNRL